MAMAKKASAKKKTLREAGITNTRNPGGRGPNSEYAQGKRAGKMYAGRGGAEIFPGKRAYNAGTFAGASAAKKAAQTKAAKAYGKGMLPKAKKKSK